MKKRFYLTSIALCLILGFAPLKNIYAQGFYFNVGGGYGFNTTNITNVNLCTGFNYSPYTYYDAPPSYGAPFSFTGANQTYTETEVNGQETWTNTYQSLNKGLGGGFNFYVSAGYAFSKYFSAEIGFSYLAGSTLQSTYKENTNSYGTPDDTSVSNEAITNKLTSAPYYRFMPAVKFSIPISKFTPYVKVGLVVGLAGKLTLSNTYSEAEYEINYGQTNYFEPTETENTGLTVSGGLSLGYTASAGVEYAINDFLSVYAELNLISENWSPTNGNITTYTETVSGVSTPPYVLTSSQFTYSNNVTTGGGPQTNSYVVQVSSEYPKQIFSYGSYGVNIGVKFSIPAKKAAANTPALSAPSK